MCLCSDYGCFSGTNYNLRSHLHGYHITSHPYTGDADGLEDSGTMWSYPRLPDQVQANEGPAHSRGNYN